MKRNISGYVSLILCIIFWASIPIASKKILVELNNIQMLFYSTIFSFIVLSIILLTQKKYKIMKTIPKKDYLEMAFLGFLGTYLYYILLH